MKARHSQLHRLQSFVISAVAAALATACHGGGAGNAFVPQRSGAMATTLHSSAAFQPYSEGLRTTIPPHYVVTGTLFVASSKSVEIYRPPYRATAKILTAGIKSPTALTVAPNGALFALNGDSQVVGYQAPYISSPLRLGSNVAAIAVDAQNRLIESSWNGGLRVYDPPYTGAPMHFAVGFVALGLFFNSIGGLFACGFTKTQVAVEEFKAPYTSGAALTITNGLQGYFGNPIGATADAAGDLFVVIGGGNNAPSPIVEYAPPYTGTPKAVIGAGVDWARSASIGAKQVLIMLNCGLACSAIGSGPGNVSVLAAPYSGHARRLAAKDPVSMAMDSRLRLFVLDRTGVSLFPPPYRTSSTKIPTGAALAIAVAR